MKNLNISIIIALFSYTLHGKDTTAAKDSSSAAHIVGLNTINFLNSYVNTLKYYSPFDYFLNYRIDYGKKALRFGIGGDFSRAYDSRYYSNGQTSSSYSYSAIVRFGFEWKKPIIGKWILNYGIDQLWRWHENRSVITNNVNSTPDPEISFDQDLDVGMGAVLGINFMINKKISLGTETSFVISYFISRDKDYYYSGTGNSFGIKSSYLYPGLVWLYIKL